MFDDIKNQNTGQVGQPAAKPELNNGAIKNQPGQNQPKPTEDIFADIDKQVKPSVFQPKKSLPSYNEMPSNKSDSKKLFILGAIIVCLVLIIGGGYYGYNKFIKSAISNPEENINVNPAVSNEVKQEPLVNQSVENNQVASSTSVNANIDSDQDGLTDEEEIQLGTDLNVVDTDNDGLFDREEVKVYGTDPLKADTDGDGYLDGEEVKGGYNPKGEGKLYEIK